MRKALWHLAAASLVVACYQPPTVDNSNDAAMCPPGMGDCDGDGSCETALNTSEHCGSCANSCDGQLCITTAEAMTCSESCPPNLTQCGSSCVDTSSDRNNCGACGIVATLPSAKAQYVAGVPAVAECSDRFGNCDGVDANGCEVDLSENRNHCGACGRRAVLPNAKADCFGGNPALAQCDNNFGDCDNVVANGCERNLLTDGAHCGACGISTQIANGVAMCAEGRIKLVSCSTNYNNCNLIGGDGCESNRLIDDNNCGACGSVCGDEMACAQGECLDIVNGI